ncbi:MAG: LAGLIDADG family homing endonuclease [Candidatus Aenigmatarchaeota archaeon]
MTQEWHVWDFPDNVRIYLNDKFRKWLFEKLKEICGSRYRLAKLLNLHPMSIKEYELGHSSRKFKVYISVKIIKQFIEILDKASKRYFLKELEKNITSYRSRGGWIVSNPKLPIRESPKLYSLIFHLIGDGCDSAKSTPYYCNIHGELINEFISSLKIFGNVKIEVDMQHGVMYVYFPKVIANLLSDIFKVEFTHPTHLPHSIFEANEECKAAAIRAFIDDEGSVSNAFYITQKSRNILKQLKILLNQFNIKTGKVGKTCEGAHRFTILKESYETYFKKIGFTCREKRRKIILEIKRIKSRKNTNKKFVMNILLKEGPMTKYEIAKKVKMSVKKTFNALVELRKDGKIFTQKIPGQKCYLWCTKESNV